MADGSSADGSSADGANPVVGMDVESLKNALAKNDPFDRLTDREKAFVEASKIFTVVCAGAINMINVFAVTMSYSHTTQNMSRMHPVVKYVFIAMTIAMLPYTMLMCALSHAVVYKTNWINGLAFGILFQLGYIGALCFLCGFFLTETNSGLVIAFSIMASIVLVLFFFIMFRRPDCRRSHSGPRENVIVKRNDEGSRVG